MIKVAIALLTIMLSIPAYSLPEGTFNQCVNGVNQYPRWLPNSYFYKKMCISQRGLPIYTSQRVSNEAINRTAFLISKVVEFVSSEVIYKMKDYNFHQAVMATYPIEKTTDIPEHAFLAQTPAGKVYWDERARGLGATAYVPTGSNAEENVLCYSNDRFRGEDITIHEFAHSLHLLGLSQVYSGFNEELIRLYNQIKSSIYNPWANHYAMLNEREYWAEAVQSYFNANVGTGPNTREDLQRRDPNMYYFIGKYLGNGNWRWNCRILPF